MIETRPVYIEDWLETLPYANFHKTVALLSEAVKATNQMPMKAKQRFELVTLYHRSYDYYVNTQIKNSSRASSSSRGEQATPAQGMKQYAIQLSHACKITVNDALGSTSLFAQKKPPTQQALMSMIYLSHALIYGFIDYSPAPKKTWLELNSLYEFASNINQQHAINKPLGESSTPTTIERAYKQILLALLSNPLHLPSGAIWEVYEQLNLWAESARLLTFTKVKNPASYFVVNTKEDMPPVSYNKFDVSLANQDHLLLDANSLGDIIKNYLQTLESGEATDNKFLLSEHYAKTMLIILDRAWGLPAQRHFPRKTAAEKIDISAGVNSCYYFHNRKEDMAQRLDSTHDQNLYVEGDEHELTQSAKYSSEQWELSDHSLDGYCISKTGQPETLLKVGELIGLKLDTDETQDNWMIGVLRWLMIRQQNNYRIGIQKLSTNAQPITIRALSGSPIICEKRRGFLTTDPKTGANVTIITDRGLYASQRKLEIFHQNNTYQIIAENLLESGAGFDQFSFKKD